MLTHRLQVLLDERRYERVAHEAKRRGLSVGAVIREAIDRLSAGEERRRTAIDQILSADPMPVPADPRELREELDSAHDRAAE